MLVQSLSPQKATPYGLKKSSTTENEAGFSRSMGVIVIELQKERFITIIDMCGQELNEHGRETFAIRKQLTDFKTIIYAIEKREIPKFEGAFKYLENYMKNSVIGVIFTVSLTSESASSTICDASQ